jgi:hypothetical protein
MSHPAPELYMPLRGWTKLKLDLQNQDEGWANIMEPDHTGFKGFTCPAPILLQDWNMNGSTQTWNEEGMRWGSQAINEPGV